MATCTSSMPTSMNSPLPVRSRPARAASTATAAYMPVVRSTMGMPTFCAPPPGRAARPVVALAGDTHQAAHRLHGEIVGGNVTLGPGLAKTSDRAVDDARID